MVFAKDALVSVVRNDGDDAMPHPTARKIEAIDAFIARKAEIDLLLARLAALSDDHFNVAPEAVNWGHVGTLDHYAKQTARDQRQRFRRGRARLLRAAPSPADSAPSLPAPRPSGLRVVEATGWSRRISHGSTPMKLSDTQLVILNTACQRADRRVLPLPSNLKGGAAEKVIASLIAKGLVEEAPAELRDPVWRTAEDDQRLTLVVTQRAFEVLGIEPEEAPGAATGAPQAARQSRGRSAPPGRRRAPLPALWRQRGRPVPERSRRS